MCVSAICLVVNDMSLQYPRYHCITPMFLSVDNSDSSSIGSSHNKDMILVAILYWQSFMALWSILYLMPVSQPPSMQVYLVAFPYLVFLSCLFFSPTFWLLQLGFCNPFYLGCFLIEPWDSLSGYVHPGIAFWLPKPLIGQVHSGVACLVFWLATFCLGVHPSMTLVKLIMIGYHCNYLDGQLNCLASTHWLIIMSEHVLENLIMYQWLCPSTHVNFIILSFKIL